ncbi:hypothetical protein J6590_091854 [Homalodisca vitripennis]|nr:hypothetical protein J6590_064743 [Homalodisca vitripennis]KAG8256611.1 hypothetical protein J6590_064745 [Homalodisca vitripennis]KAG8329204.1 hypothetical protein J6590_091854 [Homalodisca vitripennis]
MVNTMVAYGIVKAYDLPYRSVGRIILLQFGDFLLIQKRMIRAMARLGFCESCSKTFQEWKILIMVSAYIWAAVDEPLRKRPVQVNS